MSFLGNSDLPTSKAEAEKCDSTAVGKAYNTLSADEKSAYEIKAEAGGAITITFDNAGLPPKRYINLIAEGAGRGRFEAPDPRSPLLDIMASRAALRVADEVVESRPGGQGKLDVNVPGADKTRDPFKGSLQITIEGESIKINASFATKNVPSLIRLLEKYQDYFEGK